MQAYLTEIEAESPRLEAWACQVKSSSVDLLQKSTFAPPAPQFWGENTFKVPQDWGI